MVVCEVAKIEVGFGDWFGLDGGRSDLCGVLSDQGQVIGLILATG